MTEWEFYPESWWEVKNIWPRNVHSKYVFQIGSPVPYALNSWSSCPSFPNDGTGCVYYHETFKKI